MTLVAVALWKYDAQEDNELSLLPGDKITVVDTCNSEWYEGSLAGRTAFFPAAYVKIINADSNTLIKTISQNHVKVEEPLEQESSWNLVTNDQGQVYYWNATTGETSWDAPYSQNQKLQDAHESNDEALSDNTEVQKTRKLIQKIRNVAPELVRREGWVSYRAVKDFGGVVPKRSHTWHLRYAVVCVGFLIFYKDPPEKRKKTEEPSLVIALESINIQTDVKDSKRKGMFHLTTRSGAVWALHPSAENESSDWVQSLVDSSKESASTIEYDNVHNQLFSPASATISNSTSPIKKKLSLKQPQPTEVEPAVNDDKKNVLMSKLGSMFKRVLVDKEKDKEPTTSGTIVIGGDLKILTTKEKSSIPNIMKICIECVEERGISSQGIYRLSGNSATINRLKNQVNSGNYSAIREESDINAISGLLKHIEDYNDRLCEIKTLIQALPLENYASLEYLMRHLVKVAAKSEVNMMEPSNLAIVFSPSIIRQRVSANDMQAAMAGMADMAALNFLVESIIIQAEWLFDGSPN